MRRITLIPARLSVLAFVLCALFSAAPALHAAPLAMRQALTTMHLLSGLVETRLVDFDLRREDASSPTQGYSVVLTFDGVLWLFTPNLGTRPLGTVPANPARTSAEITTRLRRLAPTLGHIEVIAYPAPPSMPPTAIGLANGCFPSCLLHLVELYSRGDRVDEAGIIFLSGERIDAPRAESALLDVGHTLLVYRSGPRWVIFDPARPTATAALLGPPQIGRDVDSRLLTYAREAHYVFNRAEYHPFSAAALHGLSTNVGWRVLRNASSSDAER